MTSLICVCRILIAPAFHSPPNRHGICSSLAFNSGQLNNSHHVMTRDSISVRDTTETASKRRPFILFLLKEAIPFSVPLSISCSSAIPHSFLFSNIDAVMSKVNIFKHCIMYCLTIRSQEPLPFPCHFFLLMIPLA